MQINRIFVVAILGLMLSSGAIACTQNNNRLTGLVGLDGEGKGETIYATTSSSTNECSCGYVRFSSQNSNTEMALSILLSAKMAAQEVRIDFLQEGNCNSAYRVYVE